MKRIISVLVIGLFACVAPAMAGIGAGHTELGFDYGSTDYDAGGSNETADTLALRGGYFLNQMFEIEGQYMNSGDTVSGVDVDMNMLMVNGVFNFHPREEITPFVLVGVGRADVQVSGGGFNADDTGLAYQMAAGTRFFFGKEKRAAFRVNVSVVNQDTFDDSSTNTTFAGGFSWRIGR